MTPGSVQRHMDDEELEAVRAEVMEVLTLVPAIIAIGWHDADFCAMQSRDGNWRAK